MKSSGSGKWDVIVIGGGAAGLMAAGSAAGNGARTLLLEKMRRPARKLRISGKGRCNLSNAAPREDFMRHFGDGGEFLNPAFDHWFVPELTRFFRDIGVETVTERGGRIFPVGGRATEVVDTLVRWVRRQGCRVITDSRVEKIILENGAVAGGVCAGETYSAPKVILAAGGSSYPATGSAGDGCRLAHAAGHHITDIRPALVPLEVREHRTSSALTGLTLRNIRLRIITDGNLSDEQFGELRFEDFGVSGPVVLTASGSIVDSLRAGRSVELSLDLKPALSEQKLRGRLLRDLQKRADEPMSSLLRGLLPRQLVRVCLKACSIRGGRPGRSINTEEQTRLLDWLKDFRFTVSAHRPWSEAIVTAGGVDLSEVNPATMESRLINGLYLTGELLDIQADTGGYNLQAAFSTGRLAAASAIAA